MFGTISPYLNRLELNEIFEGEEMALRENGNLSSVLLANDIFVSVPISAIVTAAISELVTHWYSQSI